jgi:hypothetical protein
LSWTIVHGRDDISAVANQLRGAPRSSVHVMTDLAWYRTNIIGGPGAFLVVANGPQAFADAFQKLTLEVAGLASGPALAVAYGRSSFTSPELLA